MNGVKCTFKMTSKFAEREEAEQLSILTDAQLLMGMEPAEHVANMNVAHHLKI